MNAPDDSDELADFAQHDLSDETDLYFEARRKRVRTLGVLIIALSVIVPALLATYVFRDPIERFVRGEIDVTGDPTFSYQPVDEQVGGLEQIHAETLPGWLVAEANREAWGVEHADKEWSNLEAALEKDPNLLEIAKETKSILRADQEVEKIERLIYLMRSWSNYLSESKQPYLVQGNAVTTGAGSFFYIKSYMVEADVQMEVGGKPYRSRIVRRLDSTNVRESYLGATSRGADGAVVLINRLYDFVIRDVWPMIGGASKPEWAAWDEAALAELEENLSSTDFVALERAWVEFAKIQAVYDAIEARRECGNRLAIIEPGHVGLSPKTLADLERWATDDALDLCPALKAEELEALRDASQALRQDEEFQRALGAVIALLARGVAIHEARHVADDVEHDGLVDPLPCAPCDPRDSAPTRAELSAYLASFAWGPTPTLTFMQACTATDQRGGPHARAMQVIREAGFSGHLCAEGPPAEIAATSRELEAQWFGRSDRVTAPENFPRLLDLKGVRR